MSLLFVSGVKFKCWFFLSFNFFFFFFFFFFSRRLVSFPFLFSVCFLSLQKRVSLFVHSIFASVFLFVFFFSSSSFFRNASCSNCRSGLVLRTLCCRIFAVHSLRLAGGVEWSCFVGLFGREHCARGSRVHSRLFRGRKRRALRRGN
jgi:hypothetical protein